MQLETIELGVNTTIIGMGVVFGVLIILTFTTWLLTTIVDGGIERKKASEAVADIKPQEQATVAPIAAMAPASVLNANTVAAIMAAVSSASCLPISRLRFTAIRRANTAANAWSASSAADIIANRQAHL